MNSINRATAAQPASPRLSAMQPVPFNSMGTGIGMEFWEQYNHPNWQRTRARKLQEADFTCERCGTSEDQMQVHHRLYFKGRKVWEYENYELEALCNGCHESATVEMSKIKVILSRLPTECLDEVRALLLGYIINGVGPIRGTKIDDLQDSNPEPYFGGIGRLVGVASQLNKAHLIHDLCDQVEQALRGGEVRLTVPVQKSSTMEWF